MKMKKFGGTEKVVYDLVKPIADEQGYSIWDVSLKKRVPTGTCGFSSTTPTGSTLRTARR